MSSSSVFFAGGQLNRCSQLRSDLIFIAATLKAPSTAFILFSSLKPLFGPCKTQLAFLSPGSLLEKNINVEDASKVFLGLDEAETDIKFPTKDATEITGRAHWAIDVTDSTADFLPNEFLEARPHAFNLSQRQSAWVAQSRALLDWNARNIFCPACGERMVSLEVGYKRSCPSDVKCLAHQGKGVQNFQHPRTDPVIITLIVHPTKSEILLGRQKVWPKKLYSCIAGFVEPGETIEEAVQREVREETGIRVDPNSVKYILSQPWPFPNSLMIGCMVEALNVNVNLEDQELEHARWFDLESIVNALEQSAKVDAKSASALVDDEQAKLLLPPQFAVAHQLLKFWAQQKSSMTHL